MNNNRPVGSNRTKDDLENDEESIEVEEVQEETQE